MRGDDVAGRVAPLSGFHFVTHQHPHVNAVGLLGRANSHRICHSCSRTKFFALAATAAERNFHFLGCDVELVVGLDYCVHVRRLRHLYARCDVCFGACGNAEARGQRIGILFDQNVDVLRVRNLACPATGRRAVSAMSGA